MGNDILGRLIPITLALSTMGGGVYFLNRDPLSPAERRFDSETVNKPVFISLASCQENTVSYLKGHYRRKAGSTYDIRDQVVAKGGHPVKSTVSPEECAEIEDNYRDVKDIAAARLQILVVKYSRFVEDPAGAVPLPEKIEPERVKNMRAVLMDRYNCATAKGNIEVQEQIAEMIKELNEIECDLAVTDYIKAVRPKDPETVGPKVPQPRATTPEQSAPGRVLIVDMHSGQRFMLDLG